MNLDQLQGILRHLFSALGGFGLSAGIGTGTNWEQIAGGALALAAVAWSCAEKRAR